MKKYHIIDLSERNARSELKEYTFEELPEDWAEWVKVQDLFDLERFLEKEADGMSVHYKFEVVC